MSALYKIVLLGHSGVGKSNFLSRFVKNEFKSDSLPTIGAEFSTKSVVLGGQTVTVQLWDTAGQERYRAIIPAYYRHAVGALLVYDICEPTSFESVNLWLKELRMLASPNIVTILIGNKTDLSHLRAIKWEEGAFFAQRENLFFIETSAQNASQIATALHFLLLQIHQQLSSQEPLSSMLF